MPKILRSSDRKIADFQTAVTFEPLEQFYSNWSHFAQKNKLYNLAKLYKEVRTMVTFSIFFWSH